MFKYQQLVYLILWSRRILQTSLPWCMVLYFWYNSRGILPAHFLHPTSSAVRHLWLFLGLVLRYHYKIFSSLFSLQTLLYSPLHSFKFVTSFLMNCYCMQIYVYVCIYICIFKYNLLSRYNVTCMHFSWLTIGTGQSMGILFLGEDSLSHPCFAQLPVFLCVGLRTCCFFPFCLACLLCSPCSFMSGFIVPLALWLLCYFFRRCYCTWICLYNSDVIFSKVKL